MASTATRPRAKAAPRAWGPFDPFHGIFKLLTSVRFALLLLAAVAVAALLGVIFPQAPDEILAVPAAMDQYVEFQKGRYHIFAPLMRDLGLFSVFHSYWFNGLVIVLLIAVAVCTANRIPPIVRNVRRPVKRVNDRYFEHAHHRADFATPADAAAITSALRHGHYSVQETRRDGETVYLFAEKFSWAQYGTFISHLALILFLAGAVVTKVIGFSSEIVIPQGRTEPVFSTIHAGQMQVENVNAGEDVNAAGDITKYHSELAVYRDGTKICQGVTTVNNPLHCAGYMFHQTNFSPYGVELQVKNASTGEVVYDETTDLGISGRSPSPRLTITDAAGASVFDDNVVLEPRDPNLTTMYAVLPVTVNGTTLPFLLAAQSQGGDKWQFTLYHPADSGVAGDQEFTVNVPVGGTVRADGYTIALPVLNGLPLAAVQGIPGISTAALIQQQTDVHGRQYLDLLAMGSGQLGVGTDDGASTTPAPQAASAASGATQQNAATAAPQQDAPAGAPSAEGRFDLFAGQPQTIGGYIYEYVGNRSITGITVRRDPGSDFIWVATGLMLLGLGITFYLPRRRMWVKITPERTYMAGVADRIHDFGNEMRRLGKAAGSPDANPQSDI